MTARAAASWLLLGALLAAQDPCADPTTIRALVQDRDGWTEQEVGIGVRLRQRWFPTLFSGPQSVTVLEIAAGAEDVRARLDVVAPGNRARTSAIATANGALAAINGGFFAIHEDGHPLGLLRIDGRLQVPAIAGKACLGIDPLGGVRLAERPAGDWLEVDDALGAGPMLLRGGAVVDHGERQHGIRHPRSAVGTRSDGRILFVTVDGRTEKAAGMSLEELGALLAALGCDDGLNLDGGGSTTLWVAGRGVVNFPCDNKRYDHAGERAVATALLVRAPAVVVVDDAGAELRGHGWRHLCAAGQHGRSHAVADAPGASARFALTLPFAGRWQAMAWAPQVSTSLGPWCVRLSGIDSTTATTPQPGAWAVLGTFTVGDDGAATLEFATTAGHRLVVDAVRFVQVP